MLIFCDFIQVYVFTTNHHLKSGVLPTKFGHKLLLSLSAQPDYM